MQGGAGRHDALRLAIFLSWLLGFVCFVVPVWFLVCSLVSGFVVLSAKLSFLFTLFLCGPSSSLSPCIFLCGSAVVAMASWGDAYGRCLLGIATLPVKDSTLVASVVVFVWLSSPSLVLLSSLVFVASSGMASSLR